MSNNSVQSITKKLLLPLGVLIVGGSFILGASQALAGGFSLSCENIQVVPPSGRLYADCKDRSGNFRSTNLDLNSIIGNNNGNLNIGRSYQSTCRSIQLRGVFLEAECRSSRGN